MSKVLSMFRRPTPRPRRARRGVFLLPSMFTVANMFCGWACIVYAMRGDFVTAAPFVGFAMVLDLLDGRIARATGATSDFGVEFDSLADIVSFGVAPATLVFAWGLEPLGRLGWAVAFLWLTAVAVRLARFNIQGTEGDKRYFVGLPSPAAAGVPAATVFAVPGGLAEPAAAFGALAIVLLPAVPGPTPNDRRPDSDGACGPPGFTIVVRWKAERDDGAHSFRALNADGAVVQLDVPFGDGHAEPGPADFCREIRLEDAREGHLVEADAGVLNDEFDVLVARARRHGERAVPRHGVESILDDVGQRTADEGAIDEQRRQRARQVDRQSNALIKTNAIRLEHVVDDLG